MKTFSKHLAVLSSLLILPSSTQGQLTYCDPNARPIFCTPVYSPVCAYPEGCENSLCSYTAINACAACGQTDVVSYTNGECFYNSVDVDEYLQGESEHHGEELGHSGQEEETGETNEQTGGETGEGEHGEGSLEEGGTGTEEEIIAPEEEEGGGGNPVEEETEEETGVEQPVEQETEEEEQAGSGTETETEETPTTPTNPGNSSSNCPTTGVLVFVNGKFIQGTYCCGAAASCSNKVSPVCGSLNQCVGSLCRETKINSCNACQDSNVKLYFPGTCHQLFGDAEANIEPDNGDGSENSELNPGEEQLENIDDFRLLQFDDALLNIYLD